MSRKKTDVEHTVKNTTNRTGSWECHQNLVQPIYHSFALCTQPELLPLQTHFVMSEGTQKAFEHAKPNICLWSADAV